MVQDITKLNTKNWQHKRGTIGLVVQEIFDIKQCVDTIVSTPKGSVPFAPEFGCEQIEAIGENSIDAIDILRAIWLKEIPLQEPRCEITEITGDFDDNGDCFMTIYFKDKKSNISEKIERYI